MDTDNGQGEEGLSMPKKVAAGAALGVAVPAAVAVARKFMGGDDNESGADEDQAISRDSDSEQPQQQKRQSSQNGSSNGSRARSSSSSTTTSRKNTTTSRKNATTSRKKSSSSSSASSSTKGSGRTRTREQLYKQATRLKVEGRSSMNKAQLERAVERAKKR
jgi:hypothetical protein